MSCMIIYDVNINDDNSVHIIRYNGLSPVLGKVYAYRWNEDDNFLEFKVWTGLRFIKFGNGFYNGNGLKVQVHSYFDNADPDKSIINIKRLLLDDIESLYKFYLSEGEKIIALDDIFKFKSNEHFYEVVKTLDWLIKYCKLIEFKIIAYDLKEDYISNVILVEIGLMGL